MLLLLIFQSFLISRSFNVLDLHGFQPKALRSRRNLSRYFPRKPLQENNRFDTMESTSSNHSLFEYNSWNVRKEYSIDSSCSQLKSVGSMETAPSKTNSIKNFLTGCFVPGGDLSSDYYRYSLWRMLQRFIGATNHVFGTQALLLALGFQKSSAIGISAATAWIMKDALGKFARIFWASMFGRKFDADAKKWKFRSSLFFSLGNTLEIITYLCPSIFLITAAIANALKQMAMLTSSSTRNTM
jgi:hypothetical protein